ncbi:hypothetical protein ACB092_11G141100 [Castanea dentata]
MTLFINISLLPLPLPKHPISNYILNKFRAISLKTKTNLKKLLRTQNTFKTFSLLPLHLHKHPINYIINKFRAIPLRT